MPDDYEDVWMEDRLFPWLADGSMGDETIEPIQEAGYYGPDFYCDCGCGLDSEDEICPDCGQGPTEEPSK